MSPEIPSPDGSSPKTADVRRPAADVIDPAKRYTAEMVTTKGTMAIALDPASAPKTVNNFVFLARYHYFDGIVFHRVIPGFVLQGGDPTGTGAGGPGYQFADELPGRAATRSARWPWPMPGPNTNGSQFFIISGPVGRGAAAAATPCSGRWSPARTSVATIDGSARSRARPRKRSPSNR